MCILLDDARNNERVINESVTGWEGAGVMLRVIHLLVSDPFTSSDKSYAQMETIHSPYVGPCYPSSQNLLFLFAYRAKHGLLWH